MALSVAALITLADAKTFLGITESAQDTLLEALIEAASEEIESLLQGTFVIQRTVVEEYETPRGALWSLDRFIETGREYPLGNSPYFFLRRRPIVSITSIVDPAATAIAASGYAIDEAKGLLYLTSGWPQAYGTAGQRSLWTITYIAGLVADTANVPHRFRQACRLLVSESFARRQPGITSKKVGDLEIRYSDPADAQAGGSFMPPEVSRLLSGDVTRWV